MKRTIFYCFILAFLVTSCYPEGIQYYEETDLVYTNYDQEFSFTSLANYAMPDRIVKITGSIVDDEGPEFIPEPYNTQILSKIESNMQSLGWNKVSDPAQADLVLMPAVWSNTTIYYWYDYWCWYYPYYCGWGWGWYYPGGVVSYTTGTMIMTMVKAGDTSIEPARAWTAALNGLLSGAYDLSRVTKGIDQAFKQSPYLDIN
jgi:hypothetical protein